jgi:signal transduction histidine kinase
VSITNSSLASITPGVPVFPHSSVYGGHAVQFYSTDEHLIDELSRFVAAALVNGDATVIICTERHGEALEQRLSMQGLKLTSAIEQGRYVQLDAADTLAKFMVGGSPDRQLFAQLMGAAIDAAQRATNRENGQVLAFGEMVALLWADGNAEAAIRLEQLWNELASTHSFFLRCAYPLAQFDLTEHEAAFSKICAEHSAVIPGEGYTGLATEKERLQSISVLQQKAEALQSETKQRRKIQQLMIRLEKEIKQRAIAEQRLRDLSSKLLNLRDEERRRLARELHDSTGQILSALQMNLTLAANEVAAISPTVERRIVESVSLTDEAIREIRTMSYLLHPPMLDEAGLVIALDWYVDGLKQRSDIELTLAVEDGFERLPRELEIALFRVVQEALTNVHRHAHCHKAQVQLTRTKKQVSLVVQDDGKGLAAGELETERRHGVGLQGMQERVKQFGGQLAIECIHPGTRIAVTIPLTCDDQIQWQA